MYSVGSIMNLLHIILTIFMNYNLQMCIIYCIYIHYYCMRYIIYYRALKKIRKTIDIKY